KLVGIPPVLIVSAVRVDRSEHSGVGRHLQLMLERMPRQRGVVHFQIELKIRQKIILLQKADDRRGIVVVLVLRWLTRFGLNKECTPSAPLAGIVCGHMEDAGKVLLLTLHICLQKGHMSFASAPKNIVLSAESNGRVQRSFNLSSSMG